MLNVEQNIGLMGEFRVIVRRSDGSIKLDTGMQKNLILNNGFRQYLGLPMLDNFGAEQEHSSGIMNWCGVGTGNKPPTENDISLQTLVSFSNTTRDTEYGKEEPTADKHAGFVKVWKRSKYIFDNIKNQNITELGLASWYESAWVSSENNYRKSYKLCTRALIKDNSGNPIAVTVLDGEVLEVIYQINIYVDVKRKHGSFSLTTVKGGKNVTETFEYFMQPYQVESGTGTDNYLLFDDYYHTTTTWGVKEADSELTSNYSLNDADYAALNYTDISKLANKTDGKKITYRQTRSKYSEDYQISENVEVSLDKKQRTQKNTYGIYTHIHDNGIRAYDIAIGYAASYTLVRGLVVLKNTANGQGIKKTNRQMWEFEFTYTLSRWKE